MIIELELFIIILMMIFGILVKLYQIKIIDEEKLDFYVSYLVILAFLGMAIWLTQLFGVLFLEGF